MELICRAAAQADLPACCNVFADSEIYERYFSAPGALARSLENALNAGELYVACRQCRESAGRNAGPGQGLLPGCIPISRSSAPRPGPAGAAWGIFFSRSSKPWPVCKEPDALR